MTPVEQQARAMSPAERRRYLIAAGWRRIGSKTWLPPDLNEQGFYSLAAAIRTALERHELIDRLGREASERYDDVLDKLADL